MWLLSITRKLSCAATIGCVIVLASASPGWAQATTQPGRGRSTIQPRGPLEPGVRDPEVQRRFDEMRRAGVPIPGAAAPDQINPNPTRPDRAAMMPRPRLDRDADDPTGGAFAWMNSWEANRERFWPQRPGKPAREVGTVPSRVFAALRIAVSNRDANVRAQVALALAIVKHPQAMELLSKLTSDASDGVAMHAWAAIGLLNTTEAADFLKSPPTTQREVIGWTLAVGLSDKPTGAMWLPMPKLVDEANAPEAQRLSLWAMRMHTPFNARDLFLEAFNNTTDPVFHAEIMRGLAKINHPEDVANLIHIARGNYGACSWEYVAWLNKAAIKPSPVRQFSEVVPIPEKLTDELRLTSRLFDKGPIRVFARGQDPISQRARAMLDLLRVPALAALAEIESPIDPVVDTLRAEFRQLVQVRLPTGRVTQQVVTRGERGIPVDGRFAVPGISTDGQRVAMLGLGRLATGDDVRLANNILAMADAEGGLDRLSVFAVNDPLRGVAALAQGLYLHKGGVRNEHAGAVSAATGRVILPASDDLFNYYQMATESMEVRTACALAIGLAGNPDYAIRLRQPLDSLNPGQEMVWGFAILALGMLGDPQAVDLAARHIGPPRQMIDVNALLSRPARGTPMDLKELIARRAAVDGLAALGDPRALPFLYGEWGKNPFLDLEVARAIARCRKPSGEESPPGQRLDPFVEAMIRLMVQDRSPELAASAAVSLGALYEREQRARLGELIAGAAPPILPARRLQGSKMDLNRTAPEAVLSLGNPFYYLVLRQGTPPAPAPRAPQGR